VTSDPEGGSDGLPPVPYGPPSYRPPAYGQPGYGPPSYGPYGPPPPYGHPGYFQPAMRAAAADRDRTIDVLKAAYGEGRLTKEEFDARSARVMAALTYGELHAIVADLPAGPAGPPALYQPSGYYPAPRQPTNGLAGGSLACAIVGLMMPLLLIPGVIMGHIARDQIRRGNQRGDGLAIAGLVIGYLGAAFWALIIVIAATHGLSAGYLLFVSVCAVDSAATKASCGTSTRPIVFIRFLPSFCFSSSFRLRVMSPP
jgi:hypothetical protein